MSCKVSVIVPVYRVRDYIAQCAASLFSQTWDNIEYIFVDNNTPDDSIEILRGVMADFPQRASDIKIIRETLQGLGYARFAGLKSATGDYVMHVDSDDWVETCFVERMVGEALSSGADVVYCDYFKEYEGHPEKTGICRQPGLPDTSGRAAVFAIHRGIIKAFNCNKLESRTLYELDSLVIPIRNMHEDIVLQTQVLSKASKVVHLSEPLYHYRRKRRGAVTAESVIAGRRLSAEGLFYLYKNLPEGNAVRDYIGQDLLTRAAWYSLCAMDVSELESCPEAVEYLAGMKIKRGMRVSAFGQMLIKSYCSLRRILSRTR